MGLKETISEKFDALQSGDNMQYLLAGALILIIIISLISVIVAATGGGGSSPEPQAVKFYCLETGKEFTLEPEEMDEQMMMMMDPAMGGRVTSPFTNKKTAVQMTRCPACEKYFVPEYLKNAPVEGGDPMMGLDPEAMSKTTCPHCGTNLQEYYRKKAQERRK